YRDIPLPSRSTLFPYTTLFRSYLAYQGFGLLREGDDDDEEHKQSRLVRILRRWVRISDGEHEGRFRVTIDGKKFFTTAAVCLISDRKSTHLNSSHVKISYAVFC